MSLDLPVHGEANWDVKLNTALTQLNGQDTTLAANLAAEITRATLAEAANATAITAEATARATAITNAISGLVNGAPGALDTLNELATALAADESAATTLAALVATKAPLASPTFTGTPAVPTAAPGTNTTQAASTAFTTAAVAAQATTDRGTYAPLVADWTASTAYTVGQLVTNGGQVYRVSTAHTSTGSFDATKFTSQGGTSVASIPTTSANSGTSYTVAAPTHGESRLKLTLTGSPTLTLSGGTASEVCAVQLHLIQDVTGSRTVTWPGTIDWGVAGAPVLSTAAGKTDRVYLTTDDAGASFQGALIGTGYTTPVAPSAPTGLGATGSTGQVALAWTQGAANGSTVTQNKIYRSTTTGTETLLATISAATSYTDSTVTNGTAYFYKVSAVNAVGESSLSAEATATPGTVIIAADDFSRADTTGTTAADGLIGKTTPTGAKTWLNLSATSSWSNLSGVASNVTGDRFVGIDSGVADCSVQADYYTGASVQDGGIVARWVDSNNYIRAIVDPAGYYIQKKVGGTQTNVANGGGAQSVGTRTMKLTMSGSTVQLYVNGSLVLSATVADAALLTATKHGLYAGNNTTQTWDNFSVTQP